RAAACEGVCPFAVTGLYSFVAWGPHLEGRPADLGDSKCRTYASICFRGVRLSATIRKRWGLAPLLLDPGLHLIDAERGQAYDARAMVIDHHELLLLEVLENHPDLGLLDAEVGAELVCVHELADAAIDGFVEPAQERAATLA